MMRAESRNRPSLRRGAGQARRGAATVEFAVVAPFLFALLLGMVDIGQLANVGQAVSGASALGGRLAAKADTDTVDDVKSRVAGYLADRFPALSEEALASALEVTVADSAGTVLSGAALDGLDPGSPVSIRVAFRFDAVRWLGGIGAGQGRVLQTTTVVRRE